MQTTATILEALRAKADPKTRAVNLRHGASESHLGVKMGDLRAVAKAIKTDHALALELWATRIMDAQLVAILIMKPKALTAEQLDALAGDIDSAHVADWYSSYVLKEHPDADRWREAWMNDRHPWKARLGWGLCAGRIARSPEGLDVPALLDRLEREMPGAPAPTQWTMNTALAYIGIHHAELRPRALAIGEKLGIYRDYPVSKGCTSPFAPIWIEEMVRRKTA